MFMKETSGKPSVCDWLNPNNTIHNNTGQVLGWVPTQPNPKPANVLVALCDK